MNKDSKALRMLLTVVLVIAVVGNCFAFADEADLDSSEHTLSIESETSDKSGTRDWPTVRTTFFVAQGSIQNTYSDNVPGSVYGPLPEPTNGNYVFTGWYPEPMHEGIEVTSGSIVPPEDTTLYAHWAIRQTINSKAAEDLVLNLYGSNFSYLYNGINVTMWTATQSPEQTWLLGYYTTEFYIRNNIDKAYGLNVYRAGSPWNCNLHLISGNETDAQMDIEIAVSGEGHCFSLSNWGLYLTAGGTANGSNVYWSAYSGDVYQRW